MPRKKSGVKKVRLSLDLPEATNNRLHRLKDKTEAESLVATIRKALELYEIVFNAEKVFVVLSDGTRQEVKFV